MNTDNNELRLENGAQTLYKNGNPAFCYKVPPMIIPRQFGNSDVSRLSCTSNCPAFQVFNGSPRTVKIQCCSQPIEYVITEPEPSIK